MCSPRADLHDGPASTRAHACQGGLRAPDGTVIDHVRHASQVRGSLLGDAAIKHHRGIVDPNIDRPQLLLDLRRRCLDGLGIGYID
jgi:hypothetical protein